MALGTGLLQGPGGGGFLMSEVSGCGLLNPAASTPRSVYAPNPAMDVGSEGSGVGVERTSSYEDVWFITGQVAAPRRVHLQPLAM